ncbi:MAG: DUF421 domain-containing protein [Solirubrobacteraceae bacterium]|nr:DUF421 domain-containing protein [Solirubrobacteraceae bacterium]
MEIVLRASAVFALLYLLTRALGKRELSETTPFELLLLVVLGDIIQQGITQEDMSVTGAAIAASTVATWVLVLSWLTFRSRRAAEVLEGAPTVVLWRGRPLDEALRVERLTVEELAGEAREQGVTDLSAVRCVVLEADGSFSFDDPSPAGPPSRRDRPET